MKEVTQKHAGGRPSKISSLNLEQLKKLVLKGFTDKEMADFFNITEKTLNNWKDKNPKLLQSLKDWKIEADKVVERSLYERAKGYQHEEEKIFCENGKVTVVPTIRHYPPDPTSMIFWLKNRQSDKWREKTEVGIGLSEDLFDKYKNFTIEQYKEKVDKLLGHKA